MRWFVVIAFVFLFGPAYSQNYLGFTKKYIIKALKSERKDMKGPVEYIDDTLSFISYVTENKKRAVFYYFKTMDVTLENGKTSKQEICIKYVSKNMCKSYSECPEKDDVLRSLNSRFTSAGHQVWMDYTRPVPHLWVLVENENFFEVHVTEKKE